MGEISRIDAAQKTVTASWELAPCTGPAGLAIDTVTANSLQPAKIISWSPSIQILDTSLPSATLQDSGDIDFDPKHNMLFVANIAGTLTVLHRDSLTKYSVVQQVQTQSGARTMTVDHENDKVYLVTSKFGQNTTTVSEELQFRPTPIPDTFDVIVVGR